MTAKRFVTTEELVQWTYFTQRADAMIGSAVGPQGDTSSFEAIDDMAHHGWVIRSSSSSSDRVHDDAFLVHDVVCRLTGPMRRALVLHGFMRTRPDARVGARARLEVRDWIVCENPRRPGEYLRWPQTANDTKRGGNGGWFTPLKLVDGAFEVRRDRAEWEAWAEGLANVYAGVNGRLSDHILHPELPVVRPWS